MNNYKNVLEMLHNDVTNIYELSEGSAGNNWDNYNHTQFIPSEDKIIEGKYYYAMPVLAFGDYDTSCHVERANVKDWLELFPDQKDYKHVTGAYGSEGILIDVLCSDPEIIDTLCRLFNYPCINDESVSEMEQTMIDDAWESFGGRDIINALTKKFDKLFIECESGELFSFIREICDNNSLEIIIESGGRVYFPTEEIIDCINEIPAFCSVENWS
jgi:hypothetical protein